MKKLLFFSLIFLQAVLCRSQVAVQDSLALVALYNSTNGDNWNQNNYWLQGGAPVGYWFGITVNGHRVTRIALHNNHLVGNIPEEIGNLDSLSFLDLSCDTILSLPNSVGNLVTLDTLGLFSAVIDTLPPGIGNLSDLKYFDFSYSQIRYLPEEIDGMIKLEYLLGFHGKLRNIPQNIGNLTKLKVIDLQVNEIANLPASIGNCTNLTKLYLNCNQIPEVPSEIGNLTKLEDLILGKNNLDELPGEIFTLTNLSFLNFAVNNLDEFPAEIGNLTNLVNLQFFDNNFTSIPDEIGNLTNLKWIYGYGNRFDALPLTLLNLEYLEVMAFMYNALTFEDIEPFVSIPGFDYVLQDSIGIKIDTTVALNSPFRLECITGGQFNRYKWLKNGDTIAGADEYFLEWPNLSFADTGEYRCVVTNTLATDLTLFARPTRLHVIDVSGINVTPADDQEDFIIYPNPATDGVSIMIDKNIHQSGLHIILYNSCGDIIKKYKTGAENTVELNIADLSPGIYFIRMTDTSVRNIIHLKKLIVL